jgi:superfamily II DNA helicase RecQ
MLQRETGLNDSKLQLALRQLEMVGALKRLGDSRGLIGVEVTGNGELDLTASAADTERRRKHRHYLLSRIIEYAETNTCRRKFILDYFGDAGLPVAPDCCDNHAQATLQAARPVETEEDKVPLILLEIVRTLARPVGRDKLAQIAHGSHAQDILKFGYAQHRYYGKLPDYTLAQLGDIIEQLMQRGFLKTIGGEYPVVALSPQGAEALRKRIAIDVRVPALPPQNTRDAKRKPVTQKTGGTVERTLELAQKGLSATQIAQQRELTINTIYDHLAQLIREGRLALSAAVPPGIQAQIRAAMQRANGNSLTSIKVRLPDTISFGEIRCVIAARDLEIHGPTPPKISGDEPLTPADEPLFAALREWRLQIARQDELPPFMIFHDATLRAIARMRPRTIAELLTIEKIGRRKASAYGAAVLAICAKYASAPAAHSTGNAM